MKILFIAPFPPVTGQSLAVQIFEEELFKFLQAEKVNLSKQYFKNGINFF